MHNFLLFTVPLILGLNSLSANAGSDFCGEKGIWIEILGAGSGELTDGQGSSSYLVWQDDVARLLVDVGAGSKMAFERSGADFTEVEVIALSHLLPDHSADIVGYISGSEGEDRELPLMILGPDSSNPDYPSTTEFVDRLIGPKGIYRYLSHTLTSASEFGYKVRATDVPASGTRRWSRYKSAIMSLAAMPVSRGEVPSLAWRVEIGGKVIVFAGDFNNDKNRVAGFAKNADALVASHAIPEISRGALRDLYALPSELGKVADQANARMLILGHRSTRTRGRESLSRAAMEEHYDGPILFANDNECWGL
jgi:ribonuclease BN (tRNA processing enzyme)